MVRGQGTEHRSIDRLLENTLNNYMESLSESVSGSEVYESNSCIFWFISDVKDLAPQNILTNDGNLAGFDLADSPRQRRFAAAGITSDDNEARFITLCHYMVLNIWIHLYVNQLCPSDAALHSATHRSALTLAPGPAEGSAYGHTRLVQASIEICADDF